MYDPKVGRWITPDPIEFEGGDPNLYRYVGNDPVNYTDPSGLKKVLVKAAMDPGREKLFEEVDGLPTLTETALCANPFYGVRHAFRTIGRIQDVVRSDRKAIGILYLETNLVERSGSWVTLRSVEKAIGDVPDWDAWFKEKGLNLTEPSIKNQMIRDGLWPPDFRNQTDIAVEHIAWLADQAIYHNATGGFSAVAVCGHAMRAKGIANLRSLGLEHVRLHGHSYNSGRKQLESAGFVLIRETGTGRRVFQHPRTRAQVIYDGVGLNKPHWHIEDCGAQRFDRLGRPVNRSEGAAHIPAS